MKNIRFRVSICLAFLGFIAAQSQLRAQGDSCGAAVQVEAGIHMANGPSTGNGCHNCSFSAAHADWYKFIPTASGTVDIFSCLGGENTRLWVYQGNCDSLTQIASNDDACLMTSGGGSTFASQVLNLEVNCLDTYYIEWDNQWSSDSFTWQLQGLPVDSSIIDLSLEVLPPATACPALVSQPIEVVVTNNTGKNIPTYNLYTTHNGLQDTIVSGPIGVCGVDTIVAFFDLSIDFIHEISLYHNLSNDIDSTNDTVSLQLISPLNGHYTIGGDSADYENLADAASDLSAYGVCGPTWFHVRSGAYNEQILFGAISGASATNGVYFLPDTSTSGAISVSHTSDYTMALDGSSWLRFEGIDFSMSSSGNAIEFLGSAAHIQFIECSFTGDQSSTSPSTSRALVLMPNSASDSIAYISFESCEFNGGPYGLYLSGHPSLRNQHISVEQCVFSGFYVQGVYLTSTDTAGIHWNQFQSRQNAYGFGGGAIYAVNSSQVDITYNTATVYNDGFGYGLYLSGVDGAAGSRSKMVGNAINIVNEDPLSRGIYMGSSDYFDVYYNSVKNNSNGSGNTEAALYLSGIESDVRNNIIANMGEGKGFYCTTGSTTSHSHNLFYSAGGEHTNLSLDSTEYEGLPGFTSDTNLRINTWSPAFNSGVPLTGIAIDLDSITRDSLQPDLGAYEFDLPANDGGLQFFSSPVSPLTAGLNTIRVSLRNYGASNLTEIFIFWSVNGVAQSPLYWTGLLLPGESMDSVSIGTANFPSGVSELIAYTSLPNGSVDGNQSNDTIAVEVCTPLSGSYSLGGSSSDFEDFNDLTEALAHCGMDSAVVIEVAAGSGPFYEQVVFSSYEGISDSTNLMIKGNGEWIIGTPSSADRRIVGFDNARHIAIDSLNIATQTSTAWGIHFNNGSDSNAITNCTIDLSNSTASNSAGIVASGSNATLAQDGNTGSYNLISNNRIMGSAVGGPGYGIYLNGAANGTGCRSNRIEQNSISDFRSHGIYLDNCDSGYVSGNEIQRTQRNTNSAVFGIYFSGKTRRTTIDANSIQRLADGVSNATAAVQYIRGQSVVATVGNENTISNNIIGNSNSKGSQVGCYFQDSKGIHLYHNTAALERGIVSGTNVKTIGVQLSGACDSISLVNNIFFANRSGNGSNLALEIDTNATIQGSDYNCLYIDTSNALNQLVVYDSTYSDLAAWQASNGSLYDQNSTDANPAFANPFQGNFAPNTPLLDSAGLSVGVSSDYFGIARGSTPDIGAIEFTVVAIDATVIQILTPQNGVGCSYDTAESVAAIVKNLGADTIFSLDAGYAIEGIDTVIETFTLALASNDTTIIYFTNTVDLSASFAYQVRVFTDLSLDSNTQNDTLSTSIALSVFGLPYTENFEMLLDEAHGPLSNGWQGNQITDPRWEAEDASGSNENTVNTGPIYDHTTYGSSGGVYMYMETSAGSTNQEAELVSPCIDLSAAQNPFLSYWYFMHGVAMGTLYVDVSLDEGTSWTVVDSIIGQQQEDQSAPWIERVVNLCSFSGETVKIQFRGKRGNSFTSDFAIDDVSIYGAPSFADVAIVRPEFTHPYQSIPLAQAAQMQYEYGSTIANLGTDSITSIDASLEVSGATALLSTVSLGALAVCSGDTTLTFDTAATPQNLGNYNLKIEVTMAETDSIPANNIVTDTFQISDTVYARDNGEWVQGIGSNLAQIQLAQAFDILVPDTLTRISAHLDGDSGDSVRFHVYGSISGLPSIPIFSSNPVTIEDSAGWYHFDFCEDFILDSGLIFFAVEQLVATSNFGLGLAEGRYTDSTVFYKTGSSWFALSEVGFEQPLMLRAIFGHQKQLQISGDTILCQGSSVTLSASGFANVQWSNGDSISHTTITSEGTYSVTVSDNWRQCAYNDTVEIVEIERPNAHLDSTLMVDCFGSETGAIFTSVTGGSSPYSFQWSTGDTVPNLFSIGSGTYSLVVTDSNTCSDTIETVEITEPSVLDIAIDSVLQSDCGDTNGYISAIASGGIGAYVYTWSNGATAAVNSPVLSGNYSVIVTDSNGCENQASGTVPLPSSLAVSVDTLVNVSCFGDSTGLVEIDISGGIEPYEILWSTGDTNQILSLLSAGLYTVAVSDSADCISTLNVEISQPDSLHISQVVQSEPLCYGDSNGSIQIEIVGGVMPYTYMWSNGDSTSTIQNLLSDTFSVSVADDFGCTLDSALLLAQPDILQLGIDSIFNPLCFGDTTGYIQLSVQGGTMGYNYNWSNGDTSSAIEHLSASSYALTLVDENGCSVDSSFSVNEPPALVGVVVSSHLACFEDSSGAINLTVSGGTAPYEYAWSNGASTEDVDSLSAGMYTATVTDTNGCSMHISDTLSEPPLLELSLQSVVHVDCFGEATGSATMAASGGNGGYQYNWSNGDTLLSTTNLLAGVYTLTVLDSNACSDTLSISINQNAEIVGTDSTTDEQCDGDKNGVIVYSASGGVAPYTYLWNDSSATVGNTVINLGPREYEVTITDDLGCSKLDTVSVGTTFALPNFEITGDTVACGDTVALLNIPLGFEEYLWSTGDTSFFTTVDAFGNYSATVTDSNGCSNADTIFVLVYPEIIVELTTTDALCEGSTDGSMVSSVSGGAGPFFYTWNDPIGQTAPNATNLPVGVYTLTVTDSEGCTKIASDSVGFEFNDPVWSLGSDSVAGAPPVIVEIEEPFSSYLWSSGSNTSTLTALVTGTYTVTVSDGNGCTTSDSLFVDVWPTGIHSISDGPFKLFPNPSNGIFSISSEIFGLVQIDIYASDGQIVYCSKERVFQRNTLEIDLSDHGTGFYLIELRSGDSRWVKPLLLVD